MLDEGIEVAGIDGCWTGAGARLQALRNALASCNKNSKVANFDIQSVANGYHDS